MARKTPKLGDTILLCKSDECPDVNGCEGKVIGVDDDGYFDVDIPSEDYGTFTFVDPYTDVYDIISENTSDVVNSPSHYTQGSVEVINYIDQVADGYPGRQAVYAGNIIKYVSRAPYKNGVEDTKKALWYLQRLIDAMETEASE